ncbi:uncharacterized protein A4U43_C01F31030 [Asparagus officinalis]|uniref:Uncharacterized protein n=1 Tax=Asparagus officinalis TaxID=4686 RepID=A0A5P1FTG9_ASPOF|nr:F-box protein At5g03100-like [Asparagus officinalis]ONK81605.1 uncharacterized protein A4U43_C01F31030 [Asparagus officinalis]
MDPFSLLPDHLISIILSLLPFTEAARTSILSRRWRNLWVHITDFYISGRRHDDLTKQIQCIDAVLSHPQVNILKFRISLSSFAPKPVTDRWAGNLARMRVTNVSLTLVHVSHVVLQRLLSSKSLTKLKLRYCIFPRDISPLLVSCTSLRHLDLRGIETSDTAIREIISACENLSSLKIGFCVLRQLVVNHQRLECFVWATASRTCDMDIETPNLRKLKLDILSCKLRRLRVSAPMLRTSRICIERSGLPTDSDSLRSLKELLAGIRNSERLQLDGEVVQCLPSRFTPLEFASIFPKLKKLRITDLGIEDPGQISALTAFLQSFSELRELKIEVKTYSLKLMIPNRRKPTDQTQAHPANVTVEGKPHELGGW